MRRILHLPFRWKANLEIPTEEIRWTVGNLLSTHELSINTDRYTAKAYAGAKVGRESGYMRVLEARLKLLSNYKNPGTDSIRTLVEMTPSAFTPAYAMLVTLGFLERPPGPRGTYAVHPLAWGLLGIPKPAWRGEEAGLFKCTDGEFRFWYDIKRIFDLFGYIPPTKNIAELMEITPQAVGKFLNKLYDVGAAVPPTEALPRSFTRIRKVKELENAEDEKGS